MNIALYYKTRCSIERARKKRGEEHHTEIGVGIGSRVIEE
jgi:hypothetical protein